MSSLHNGITSKNVAIVTKKQLQGSNDLDKKKIRFIYGDDEESSSSKLSPGSVATKKSLIASNKNKQMSSQNRVKFNEIIEMYDPGLKNRTNVAMSASSVSLARSASRTKPAKSQSRSNENLKFPLVEFLFSENDIVTIPSRNAGNTNSMAKTRHFAIENNSSPSNENNESKISAGELLLNSESADNENSYRFDYDKYVDTNKVLASKSLIFVREPSEPSLSKSKSIPIKVEHVRSTLNTSPVQVTAENQNGLSSSSKIYTPAQPKSYVYAHEKAPLKANFSDPQMDVQLLTADTKLPASKSQLDAPNSNDSKAYHQISVGNVKPLRLTGVQTITNSNETLDKSFVLNQASISATYESPNGISTKVHLNNSKLPTAPPSNIVTQQTAPEVRLG